MADIDHRAAAIALVPLVLAVAAVCATWYTGLTTPMIEAEIDSPYLIFGLFAERFPILIFPVVYALARLVMVALFARRPFILFRLVLLPLALLVVLGATFYPTFGGYVARSGFAGGGISIINSVTTTSTLALALGGALAGIMLGLVTGLARMIIDWTWSFGFARLFRALLTFVAYGAFGAILVVGWSILTGAGSNFPRGPISLVETIGLSGLIILGGALIVVITAWAEAARRPVNRT